MGQNFDDYPGFQQIPGMPILLQQSVLWKKIYCLDKDIDENEVIVIGDMELTVGQIIGPRNGKPFSKKWPEGKVPYTFHESLLEQERNILEKIFKRFNKDLKGCLRVRYLLLNCEQYTKKDYFTWIDFEKCL